MLGNFKNINEIMQLKKPKAPSVSLFENSLKFFTINTPNKAQNSGKIVAHLNKPFFIWDGHRFWMLDFWRWMSIPNRKGLFKCAKILLEFSAWFGVFLVKKFKEFSNSESEGAWGFLSCMISFMFLKLPNKQQKIQI